MTTGFVNVIPNVGCFMDSKMQIIRVVIYWLRGWIGVASNRMWCVCLWNCAPWSSSFQIGAVASLHSHHIQIFNNFLKASQIFLSWSHIQLDAHLQRQLCGHRHWSRFTSDRIPLIRDHILKVHTASVLRCSLWPSAELYDYSPTYPSYKPLLSHPL